MPILTSGIDCTKLELVTQTTLAAISGGLYPHDISLDTYGTFFAVQDSIRSAGVSRLQTRTIKEKYTDGGTTILEVKYKTKRCPSATAITKDYDAPGTDHCPTIATNINEYKCARVVMGAGIEAGFGFGVDDFRTLIQDQPEALAEHLIEVYEALMAGINSKWATQLIAAAGKYKTDDIAGDCANAVDSVANPMTLKLTNASGHFNPMGAFPISQQYKRMGVSAGKRLIGGEHLDVWQHGLDMNLSSYCCDGATGRPKTAGISPYVDYTIDSEVGSGNSHVISFVDGSVQPVFYYDYDLPFSGDPTVKMDVFDLGAALGKPSLLVDRIMKIDACTRSYVWQFRVHTELISIPDAAFEASCDQCNGYVLNWLADCGDTVCADYFTPKYVAP